jgi:serine/threonine protein kinase
MTEPQTTEPESVGPGRVLGGKYRVEKIIGSGGMGIVVSARHITMNHLVAIKILNLEDETDREEAISRFLREARAAARIDSDHVVRVTDVSALEDFTPYMVMELMEGSDFRKVLHQRGPLPIAEAVGYVLQACEGLSAAHAAGVIHRDLKPSNLFLAKRPNGTEIVKVLDFGISKVSTRPGEVAITTTNTLMGSPVYMAPEQMRSTRTVDSRADIWSLGLILYELLTGETAFSGDTVPEVCVAVMSGEPRAISDFRDDVPQELQAVLLKCMAKDRAERYPTMAAFARDLARFADVGARVHADRASASLKVARPGLETESEVLVPPSTHGRAARVASAPSELPRDPDTQKSWSSARKSRRGSKRTAWIAIAVIACSVALGVGMKLARVSSSEPQAIVASPPTPTTPSATIAPQPPPTSDDLRSVPFDSLPLSSRDSGAPRALRFAPPHVTQAPSATPAITPAPSTTPPSKKDDWKWGDRN